MSSALPPDRPPGRPPYRVRRARPEWLDPGAPTIVDLRARERPGPGDEPPGRRRRIPRPTPRRVLRIARWTAIALAAWVGLSAALFLVSAQLRQDRVDAATKEALTSAGLPIVAPATVLILGSDQRPKGTREPGAGTSGPSRSDSIQLLRAGGGHSAKLAIPRDTVVPIPGHGVDKINAAYAFGGTALAVRTVREYLGIDIDHVIVVDFTRFPQLINAMGGIDYSGGCVVSRINGGARNGGYTLRLRAGTTHLDGRQALALSRTRENLCNRRENDLTRARRQQKVIAGMRSRVFSVGGFLRWPMIAWRAPATITSDMGAAGLSALLATIATSGNAPVRVLRPTGSVTLPDGGSGLLVAPQARRRQVQRFLET